METEELSIVYYIYINPDRNWKIIIEGQVNDIKVSKIEYRSIYIHICCKQPKLIEDCKQLINDIYLKDVIYSESYINQFEYPGLKLLYDLSQNSSSNFLYIHSKGMVYNNNYSIRSIAEQPALRSTLFYWKKAIFILKNNVNINKVGLWPSDKGYMWLNFFYIRGSYIKNPPIISDYRYYYEEYIASANNKFKDWTDCYSLVLDKIGCYDKHEVMAFICNLKNIPFTNDIDTYFSKLIPTFSIFYGTDDKKTDITKIALDTLTKNTLYIPSGDSERSMLFNIDPVPGILKNIYIIYQGIEKVYYYYSKIYIDINEKKFYQIDTLPDNITISVSEKLSNIQSSLKLDYGNFADEYPEQIMAVTYLKGHEKVLEIGGNIGRNSLIISKLLNDSSNLLTVECDPYFCSQLKFNRNLNSLNFNIENAAISKRPLIQKGWDTMVSEELLPGYKSVNIIDYNELYNKWNIKFDTLTIDCEGAFYYILMDYPHILNNITLIIMENDYHNIDHKIYIDTILKQNNFKVDYSKPGGWGPCELNFYEVWVK